MVGNTQNYHFFYVLLRHSNNLINYFRSILTMICSTGARHRDTTGNTFKGINSGLISYFFGEDKKGTLTVDRWVKLRPAPNMQKLFRGTYDNLLKYHFHILCIYLLYCSYHTFKYFFVKEESKAMKTHYQ